MFKRFKNFLGMVWFSNSIVQDICFGVFQKCPKIVNTCARYHCNVPYLIFFRHRYYCTALYASVEQKTKNISANIFLCYAYIFGGDFIKQRQRSIPLYTGLFTFKPVIIYSISGHMQCSGIDCSSLFLLWIIYGHFVFCSFQHFVLAFLLLFVPDILNVQILQLFYMVHTYVWQPFLFP